MVFFFLLTQEILGYPYPFFDVSLPLSTYHDLEHSMRQTLGCVWQCFQRGIVEGRPPGMWECGQHYSPGILGWARKRREEQLPRPSGPDYGAGAPCSCCQAPTPRWDEPTCKHRAKAYPCFTCFYHRNEKSQRHTLIYLFVVFKTGSPVAQRLATILSPRMALGFWPSCSSPLECWDFTPSFCDAGDQTHLAR